MADPSPPAPLSSPLVLSSQDASRDNGSPSAETAETYMGESDCQELLQKVRNLMRRITAARPSPHPRFLHNLAAILEEEEARFEKEAGHPIPSSARSTYAIGRLVSLIRENDDFFELLSSRLLVGARHSNAVRAGAARLLLACLTCGMYPDAFDDSVLSNIKQWVIDETPESDSAGPTKSGSNKSKGVVSRDWQVLKTYSLGLLAIALTTGGGIIEEMLGQGVASKLMHFLRLRALKESCTQKEVALAGENRSIGVTLARNKDSRIRLPAEVLQRENTRDVEERGKLQSDLLERENFSKDKEELWDMICRDSYNDMLNSTHNAADVLNWMGDDSRQRRDKVGKFRYGDQQFTGQIARVDDSAEFGREEHSKWRGDTRDRGYSKIKGRRIGDGALEGDRTATLQVSGSRLLPERTKGVKEKSTSKNVVGIDSDKSVDKMDIPIDMDFLALEVQNDFIEQNVYAKVGGVDISEYVRQAARAAQAEAWAAKAPPEVIRAVGEAAAELVRAAALEVLDHSAGEEVALNAAKSAAATVVNAAAATRAIKVSNQDLQEDCENSGEELEEAELVDCVPSASDLLKLRERYSVQCLERLGEYLEVLGPVLHERGVDVCLALLQRESSISLSTKDTAMLLEVLKLICALAAHRKFSALFVDKGGVQQILAVPRLPQTYTGVSLCLFAFASVQGVMERVCAAPVDVVSELVGLALHLLEFAPDPAKRNAALFFGAAFVFRAILDCFDAQDGLHRLLSLLQNAAATRSGGGSNLVTLSPTSRTDRGASTEVLTSYEKQTAYHTCIALRQYFRAHLLILIDSLRPLKGRSGPRSNTGGRAAFTYKPLDLSSEAVDALVVQVQRDKKVGPLFVKARWQAAETFMHHSGHLTLLELTQVSPEERYLRDIAQHALGILHILTLMPVTRKSIVSSVLSNGRSGMAVILDAASAPTEYVEPEIIQPALLVLANLVCPPPSLSKCSTMSHNTPILSSQQQCTSFNTAIGVSTDAGMEQHAKQEVSAMKGNGDLVVTMSKDPREVNSRAEILGDKNRAGYLPLTHAGNHSPTAIVVGDRKICLGSAAGGSGLAACIEQGYRHARDIVRANNGIKVLLHLLSPSTVLPPASSDCIRSLACRVLLGLARDNAIAHILTKLQVGKLLSELLREGSGHAGLVKHGAGDQGRWQVELGQVSMELIALVTNAGRTTTIVASDAAAPTLRRIERAAIAAATPINYPARELLQLIHEHLVLSGLTNAASALLKEAQLAPLPSVSCHATGSSHYLTSELPQGLQQWPLGRVPKGFFVESAVRGREGCIYEHTFGSSQKRGPRSQKRWTGFSSALILSQKASLSGMLREGKDFTNRPEIARDLYSCRVIEGHKTSDTDISTHGATNGLPVKRKLAETNFLSNKRPYSLDCQDPPPTLASPLDCRGTQVKDHSLLSNPQCQGQERPLAICDHQESKDSGHDTDTHEQVISPGSGSRRTQTKVSHIPLISNSHCQNERASLDSLVVQYLKHQHRQCPAPITTLPPLSLFHPHICPEPSRACYAPLNTAKRFSARETFPRFGGVQGRRRDRHFVYSRFRPLRPCRDDRILTSSAFLGTTLCLAASSQAGEICLFDCNTGNLLETHTCHQSSILSLHSASVELDGSVESTGLLPGHLLLSSGSSDARLWNSSALGGSPLHSFDGCKLACFNNSASLVAAISTDSAREVLLYDVETGKMEQRLPESSSFSAVSRGNANCCSIHFSRSDSLLLWKGLLWDHRVPQAVHQFDQFTDYGGGGFHPAGNEVIINSEIWDLRFFKLLRNVPSLNQTVINFNSTSDVIYATLRRNSESGHHRRSKHPLSTAFRTVDAVDYTDIATTPVDRCVLNLATEPNNCLISVVGVDVHNEMDSIARLYEVGRRKPSDDDSDPDDGAETDDDEDDFAEEAAEEEDEEDGSDADESNDEDGSGDEDEAEDGDADADTNEEDDDAIEVDGSIVELISDGEDDETRMSYSSGEDASVDDSDEEW